MSQAVITRSQGARLAVAPPASFNPLSAANLASVQTGFALALLGGVATVGVIGYGLVSYGAGRRKHAMASLGVAGLVFWVTKKAILGALSAYKQYKGIS